MPGFSFKSVYLLVALSFFLTNYSKAQSSASITSLAPYHFHAGDTVVISGSGFDTSISSNNKVDFVNYWDVSPGVWQYDTLQAELVAVTGSLISAKVPAGAFYGAVSVFVNNQIASSPTLLFWVDPTIKSIKPDSASVGDTITIKGTGFDLRNPQFNYVYFANAFSSSPYAHATDSSLSVLVPLGSTTGTLKVSVESGAFTTSTFKVIPKVGYAQQFSGEVGAQITIYNTSGFGAALINDYAVSFNGILSPVTIVGVNFITTSVPSHATSGPVWVLNNGEKVKTPSLTYTFQPTTPLISSLSVTSGPAGTPFTIIGTGFSQGGLPPKASISGFAATVYRYSDDTIYTSVPKHAYSGSVHVWVDSITVGGPAFDVTQQISSMYPTLVNPGDTVTVTATGGFAYSISDFYKIQFSNSALASTLSVTDTTLSFIVPWNAASGVPTIMSTYALNTAIPLPYLGIRPIIKSIKPDIVIAGRSQVIVIRGTGLLNSFQTKKYEIVFKGGAIQTKLALQDTALHVVVPSQAKTGPITLLIDSLSGVSKTSLVVLPDTFPYTPYPPMILNPASITASSFVARWQSQYRVIGYSCDVSIDNFASFVSGNKSKFTTDTTQLIFGLQPGTKYQLRVRAFSDTDTSAYCMPANFLTVPAAPVLDPLSVVDKSDYLLMWEPVKGADSYIFEASDDGFNTFISASTTYHSVLLELVQPSNILSFSYRVQALNASGASAYSNAVSVVTEDAPNPQPPILYPNPGTDQILIAGINASVLESELIDSTGKTTSVNLLGSNNDPLKLDIRSLANGVYIVRIVTSNGTNEFRFVKQ